MKKSILEKLVTCMHCLFFNGAYASMKVTINLFKKISFWVSAAPKSWPKYTSTFWLYRNITRVIFLNPIKSGIEKWSLQSITRLITQWKRLTSKHPTQKMDSGHHSNHQRFQGSAQPSYHQNGDQDDNEEQHQQLCAIPQN